MCLSGATCLYVVRSQVHNSVSGAEWSDMSICGPFTIVCLSGAHVYMWSVLRFTIVCLSGATCLYVVRSQVHNSVSEWSDMSICGPFSGSQ